MIGEQPTALLVEFLGGLRISIPSMIALRRAERDRRIRALLDGGATLDEAARQEAVSRRMVAVVAKRV